MIRLMNLLTTLSLNLGSGKIFLFGAWPLRDINHSIVDFWVRILFDPGTGQFKTLEKKLQPSLLRFFRSVFGTTLTTFLHTLCVVRTPNNVIPHTGQILDTTASDQHNRMFLQIMTFTRNV